MHVKSETINKRGSTLYASADKTICRGVWLECARFSPSPVLLTVHGIDGMARMATVVPGASQLIYLKEGVARAAVEPQTGNVAFIRHMVMHHTGEGVTLKSA